MTEKDILGDFAERLAAAMKKDQQELQAKAKPIPEGVKYIHVDHDTAPYRPKSYHTACGNWVSVRVAGDETKKTRLGVYIGDIALGVAARVVDHDDGSKILDFGASGHNPAMYVPSLKRVVFGAESWWGRIESPDKLREITDEVIDGVWYVQALKALSEEAEKEDGAAP